MSSKDASVPKHKPAQIIASTRYTKKIDLPKDDIISQTTLKSTNILRFGLLAALIVVGILIAPYFITNEIFNICLFFTVFIVLIYAFADLIIYLSKDSQCITKHPREARKTGRQNPKIRLAAPSIKFSGILKSQIQKIIAVTATFFITFAVAVDWEYVINQITTTLKYFSIENAPLGISLLATLVTIFFLFFAKRTTTKAQKTLSGLTNKYFIATLAGLAFLGGTAALYIPSYTNWFRETNNSQTQISENQKNQNSKDQASDLRLHILYITGGVIAVLGLIETNRKNSQDHIREVHAARRKRYIEAVDKLSSKDAPVRFGGVYALVALVDEWLEDDNIDRETQIKEGQVIINNLCAYIRSPFTLAVKAKTLEADSEPDNYEGDFSKDQAAFHEEQDVRRAIFVEMSKHSSDVIEEKGKVIDAVPGPWSDFEFNFSRAPFFYPLEEIKFINANFNNAKFYGHTDFSRSQFYGETNMQHVNFYGPTLFDYTYFHNGLNLSFSHFHIKAGVTSSTVREKGIFCETHFHKEVFFSDTDFLPEGSANFFLTKFHQRAVFNNTNFYGEAIFSADFMSSTSFEGAHFEVEPNFEYSQFSDKEEHNFETRESSPYHIKIEVKNHEGKLIKLPIGAGIYTSNVEKNLPSNNSKNLPEL